jgi:peptide/nickel transport system ATP-binding protein
MDGNSLLDFRREIQAIFQDPYASFNPFYRVERALVQPLLRFGLARNHDQAMTIAANACRDVGLDSANVLGRFPHELSGGQRQRLMVARALALKPRLIVADEPVSMVDASLRMSILANLVSLKNDHGISAIYITHDLATAHQVSDHVIVLLKGRIVEEGPPQDVIADPRHPYTQALVAAIPWPDPARGWPEISDNATAGWEQAAVIRSMMGKANGGSKTINA